MPKQESPTLMLDDPAGLRLQALWSRSGARAGIAIWEHSNASDYRQIELTPDQVEQLITYLTETLASEPADR
jgi:hypothetical protein